MRVFLHYYSSHLSLRLRRGHFQRLFRHCVSVFMAVRRYHELSGLKSHLLSHGSGDQHKPYEAQVKVSAGLRPSGGSEGDSASLALCSFWCCLHLLAHGPSSECMAPATAFVIMRLLPAVKSPSLSLL